MTPSFVKFQDAKTFASKNSFEDDRMSFGDQADRMDSLVFEDQKYKIGTELLPESQKVLWDFLEGTSAEAREKYSR